VTVLDFLGHYTWVAWVALKHGFHHTVHGFKLLGKDGKWAVKTTGKSFQSKYELEEYKKHTKLRSVRKDFIKFVPFSLFLLIPGGELFLPAWIVIFPNSIPSQFVAEEDRLKKFKQMKDLQENSAEKLLYILPNYFQKLLDMKIDDEDKEKIRKLKALIKEDEYLPTDLIDYRHLFAKYAKFSAFKTRPLIHMANFMTIKPVTGFNTINNILGLFKLKIPIDHPFVTPLTRVLVARELNMLFTRLRKDDLLLDAAVLEELDDDTLAKICFQRAININ
jgi:hypothetical protein